MVSVFASYWSIGSRLWTLGSSSNCDYEKKDLNLFKIVRRSTPISFNSNSTSYYYNNEVNMKSWRLCNSPMRKKILNKYCFLIMHRYSIFAHILVSDIYHTGIVLDTSKIHTQSIFLFLKNTNTSRIHPWYDLDTILTQSPTTRER